MSGTTNADRELDRALAAWLAEGPASAPDRPVDLAMDHARAHPRRRDLLGFLRQDVMPSRAPLLGTRPAWSLVALALLVLALAAVAVIGSQPRQSVVPVPSTTPSPSAPASPAVPSPRTVPVVVTDELGHGHDVVVVDRSGRLVDAASGQVRADDRLDSNVTVRQDGASALRLSWVTCPTDSGSRLEIDEAGQAFAFEVGACQGDALGVGVALVLTFSGPIDAASVEVVTTHASAEPQP